MLRVDFVCVDCFSKLRQERLHLPNVGSEVGEEVSKGAVVGANDKLHEDAADYAAQAS